jgi:tetratricopeptide (TPR) repeat protein
MRTWLIVFVSVFLLHVLQVNAQSFDIIKTTPKKDRSTKAYNIFAGEYLHKDSVSAFRALAQLNAIAIKLQDTSLQLGVYGLRAGYYYWNYGDNPMSSACYDKAAEIARNYGLAIELGNCIFGKGEYYNECKKYAQACANFLQAYDIYKKAGFDNVPNISTHLMELASFYYNLGDFETSKRFLLEALAHKPSKHNQVALNNTIGMIYRSSAEYNKAILYFNKALSLAKKYNDPEWQGITTGNIGSVYFLQKDYDAALPLMKTDFETSVKYKDNINAAIAMLRLVTIDIERKDFAEADKGLSTVETLIKPHKAHTLKQRMDDYALRAELYEQTGRPAEAIVFRKKYEGASDSLIKEKDVLAVQRLKLNYEIDKQQLEVQQLNDKAKAEVTARNTLAGILFLLMVISVLVYNRQKLVNKKDKAVVEKQQVALQLEISRAEEDRNKARLALMEYTDNLRQKNDLIERFKAELDGRRHETDPAHEAKLLQQQEMLKAHIMTDQAWQEFKKLFAEVHPLFFDMVNNRFTNLTETDLRLMALMKLKLSKREMAAMLGITAEGVKKSKQRLRKKTGIPEEDGLEDIVAAI